MNRKETRRVLFSFVKVDCWVSRFNNEKKKNEDTKDGNLFIFFFLKLTIFVNIVPTTHH